MRRQALVAAAVALFLALLRLTGATGRSAFVAGAFALHPLHVESVGWAAARKDPLSGLFFWLGLLAYARYCERPGSRSSIRTRSTRCRSVARSRGARSSRS